MRVQLNGLDATVKAYDTWSGVRISAAEVHEFASKQGLLLLALEGVRTQYMWATLQKPGSAGPATKAKPSIRRVTNAESSEPLVPARGRFAALALSVEHLPATADLNSLTLQIEGQSSVLTYIGPREWDGLQQVNAIMGEAPRTGVVEVRLSLNGVELCPPGAIHVVPAPPPIPALISVADGVDLLSGLRIVSGIIKVTVEEVLDPDQFGATIDGQPLAVLGIFCTDPLPPRHEINLQLPENLPSTPHLLELRAGRRWLGTVEVVPDVRRPAEG
jgi:hypothetical protein